MMYQWRPEHIRFMRDAAAYGNYHRRLAEKLLSYLPSGGRICDAGCGMGYLSQALAPYFGEVTACDVSQAAMQELQMRIKPQENIRCICGDIEENPPQEPYDGMVFCLFGSSEVVLRIAKEQCRGPVCVVSRAKRVRRFSVGHQVLHRDSANQLTQLLRRMDVPFQREEFSLEFGQPFCSEKDAMAFFELYNQGDRAPKESDVTARLSETGRSDFPYYLPEEKHLVLLCFDSRDLL